MSLDKTIASGKEWRKPYRKSKAFDPACRNNTCPYCLGNKRHATRKREASADDEVFWSTDEAPPVTMQVHERDRRTVLFDAEGRALGRRVGF
jgi:hypothetical protein